MKDTHLNPDHKKFQQEKIELIQLRIRNKYYDRDEVLERVVHSIIKKEIRNRDDNNL